ncbi:hypothetical protein [Methylosinus sp. Sm6]|uniref:hypothetical protein n=1 Tax=Methylosinus sp. Sm6 TaxID=2866948 RepID=UPI001C99780F|nr:hypothetical protein [Methylosinus sp. Sm6]MBY6244086.1 hypothetical protein [Methylosinus sp. Sm6]
MSRIGVSDHALVRFLERAGGFDVEALHASMEASLARAAAVAGALEQSRYTIKCDGLIYVVEHGVVITIVGDHVRIGFTAEERRR